MNLKDKIITLDSNIFIYYFQEHPQFGPPSSILFKSFLLNKAEVVTSSISLTEVLSVKASSLIIDSLKQEFLSIPFLSIITVSNDIAVDAARIRREYGFGLPDSIQLATALYAKAKIFITNDERLKKFKEIKVILLSELN